MNWKKLYVDMDGTLAVFNNQIESEEVLYQKGYYRDLPPQQNVIDAVRLLAQREDVEVFVLSAVLPTPYAQPEKDAWLNEYLPEVDSAHRIYVPCGEDKGKYIGHTLGENDLLLDDYSKNLHSWCPPGRAVKLMNDINGRFGTWQGERVSYQDSPQQIADKLLVSLGLKKRVYRGYEIVKSQWAGNQEVVIGHDPDAVPGLDKPYVCWFVTGMGGHYILPMFCNTKEEALAVFHQRFETMRATGASRQTESPQKNAMQL